MILNNLDEIYQEVLEELSYRVGIVNLKDSYHFAIFNEILIESKLAPYSDVLIQSLCEADESGKIWVKNIDSKNVYQIQKGNFDKLVHTTASSQEVEKAQSKETEPSKTEKPKLSKSVEKPKKEKNKELKKINTLETDTFNIELEPNDTEFEKQNEKIKNPIPPQPYKLPTAILQNTKFPKKYIKTLERMMNSRPVGDGINISHYNSLAGGAGKISSQAGELIAMMGVSMSDKDFDSFYNSLMEHTNQLKKENPNLENEKTRVVQESWINAAKNNRKAILKRINKFYPDSTIVATCWDVKNDVESLGLDDYSKNKGLSTDIYLKLKLKDGKEILDEVSLKKSSVVFFLNSGAGKFLDWDNAISDNLNQKIYNSNQKNKLVETATNLKNDIEKLLDSNSPVTKNLKAEMKKKGIDFQSALNILINGKPNRGHKKIIYRCIEALADNGNAIAKEHINTSHTVEVKFREDSVKAIVENPKLKEGMLNEIRSEFPLKSVATGEETMAIGEYSLDADVMKSIFGTTNYDDIKEKLVAEPGPPAIVGYKANVLGNTIPLATIHIREDGVGYGGILKFEMKLHTKFAKLLAKANIEVYG